MKRKTTPQPWSAILPLMATTILILPISLCVAQDETPSDTVHLRQMTDLNRPQQQQNFHYEYEVRGHWSNGTQTVVFSWRYPTVDEAGQRLMQIQHDYAYGVLRLADIKPTDMHVVPIRVTDPAPAPDDELARKIAKAQELVARTREARSLIDDAHFLLYPVDPHDDLTFRSFPLKPIADRLRDYMASVATAYDNVKQLQAYLKTQTSDLTAKQFTAINRTLASFNENSQMPINVVLRPGPSLQEPPSFKDRTGRWQVLDGTDNLVAQRLRAKAFTVPPAGYVVTGTAKTGTFGDTTRTYFVNKESSLEAAVKRRDKNEAFYTRYSGRNNDTLVQMQPIYTEAQFNDDKAIDKLAGDWAAEVRSLPDVVPTYSTALANSQTDDGEGVWVTSIRNERPFADSGERSYYKTSVSKSEADKLASDWQAQGFKPKVQKFANEGLAKGYLEGDAVRWAADRAASRKRQRELAQQQQQRAEQGPQAEQGQAAKPEQQEEGPAQTALPRFAPSFWKEGVDGNFELLLNEDGTYGYAENPGISGVQGRWKQTARGVLFSGKYFAGEYIYENRRLEPIDKTKEVLYPTNKLDK